MAVNDYLTVEEFRLRTRIREDDSTDDALIGEFVTAVSRWVDRFTGRAHEPGAFAVDGNSAETRYFDGVRDDEIWIDECVSIETVATSDDFGETYDSWASTDYWTSDGARYGKTPIRLLVANPNGDYAYFSAGRRALRISAIWGYSSAPPEPVKEAVTIVVRNLYHMRDGAGDADRNIITAEGFVIPAEAIPPKAKALLVPYRRYTA